MTLDTRRDMARDSINNHQIGFMKVYYKGKEIKRDKSTKQELWLDISDIPDDEFTLSRCIEVYDKFVKRFQAPPSKLVINDFQRGVMSSPIFGDWEAWRGIPITQFKPMDWKTL